MPEFKWTCAIVLGIKNFGENTYIVSIFTPENGRFVGIVKSHHPPQIGDLVSARWNARLMEQMGHLYFEIQKSTAAFFLDDWGRLSCLKSICELLNHTLPERQIYSNLFNKVLLLINKLDDIDYVKHYIFFEKDLLTELGFGLDLSQCAGGGDNNDLAYVSPKTGRAVSRTIGAPYHNKLLPLPKFLWQDVPATEEDLKLGLNLTGYFLQKNTPIQSLPDSRNYLLKKN